MHNEKREKSNKITRTKTHVQYVQHLIQYTEPILYQFPDCFCTSIQNSFTGIQNSFGGIQNSISGWKNAPGSRLLAFSCGTTIAPQQHV